MMSDLPLFFQTDAFSCDVKRQLRQSLARTLYSDLMQLNKLLAPNSEDTVFTNQF